MSSSKFGSRLHKVRSLSNLLRPSKWGKKGRKGDDKKHAQVQEFIVQDLTVTTPTPTPPSSSPDDSSPDEIPENILAFRTITKLLSKIQQDRRRKTDVIQSELDAGQRVELEISDAFATVAVTEHEAVAVATNHRIHPETLQVVVSVQSSYDSSIPPTQASTLPAKPTISDVAALAGIDLDADKKIKEIAAKSGHVLSENEKIKIYAEQHWSNLTTPQHLWILSKLLSMIPSSPNGLRGDSSALIHCILPYVISTCHRKISLRLKAGVSKSYIKSLVGIEDFKLNETLLLDNQPTRGEIDNDRQFLIDYVLGGLKMHALKFPELVKQAELARDNKNFQLYSAGTCIEFHLLFKDILQNFGTALRELGTARPVKQAPMPASAQVNKLVHRIIAYEYALQRLAQGFGLKMHLQTIMDLLQQALANLGNEGTQTTQTEDDDWDDELNSVHPSTMSEGIEIPLWRKFLDWLKLIIAHFDAVDILIQYVTSPHFTHNGISIQFMTSPPTGPELLPWRRLFKDRNLFPIVTLPVRSQDGRVTARPKANSSASNEEILGFIEKALKTVSAAAEAAAAWRGGNIPETIAHFKRIENSNLPGWTRIATTNLLRLRNIAQDAQGNDPVMDEYITADIALLCSSTQFFNCLDDGKSFKGAVHCEACLASLLAPSAPVISEALSTQLQGLGPVIGISKRSCPVCQQLLSRLSRQEFVVSGSHNTVTACSLPTWLPSHVVDSMNQYFGGQLRRELVDLMDRFPLIRKRKDSTGSHRLSADVNMLNYVDFSKVVDLATAAVDSEDELNATRA